MTELYSNEYYNETTKSYVKLTEKQLKIREACLSDFYTYIMVIAPYLQLGHCHEDLARMLQNGETHRLIIYPRGHLKSKILALFGSWLLTCDPTTTILNASATHDLSIQQLADMKRIFESSYINPNA